MLSFAVLFAHESAVGMSRVGRANATAAALMLKPPLASVRAVAGALFSDESRVGMLCIYDGCCLTR